MATQEKSNRPWELVILQAKFCHCLQILIACKTHSYPMRTIGLFALYSLKEQTIQINHKIIENIRDQNKQKAYLWVFIILFKGQLCKHTQWDPTQTYLRIFSLVWFSTTTIKQISQKSESHDFFGFPVHIKFRLALYCLWSVQQCYGLKNSMHTLIKKYFFAETCHPSSKPSASHNNSTNDHWSQIIIKTMETFETL